MTTGFAGRFNPNLSANLSVNLVESSKICPNVLKKGWFVTFRTETEVRGIGGIWNHSSTEKSTIFFLKRQLGPTLLLSDQIATPSFKDYECGQLGNPSSLAPKKQYVNLHVNDTNPSCQTLPKSPISRTWFSNLLVFVARPTAFNNTRWRNFSIRKNVETTKLLRCEFVCDCVTLTLGKESCDLQSSLGRFKEWEQFLLFFVYANKSSTCFFFLCVFSLLSFCF